MVWCVQMGLEKEGCGRYFFYLPFPLQMAGGSACVALSLLGLVGCETRSCEVSDDACGCLRRLIVDQILRRVKGPCLGEGHNLGGLDEYLEMISLLSLAYRYPPLVCHRVSSRGMATGSNSYFSRFARCLHSRVRNSRVCVR
jgi:hypothetical protein